MSISSSLFSGVSGLSVYGNAMTVIGDNIANVNTVGFKGSSCSFADALSQSISTASGTAQIGRGVTLSSVSASFTQGSFESTNEPTDLAIGGDGFFMVNDPNGDGTYYTRAGHFGFDVEGNFASPSGLVLQGWEMVENADGTIGPSGALGDIKISATSSEPNRTSTITIAANLDSRETGFDLDSFAVPEDGPDPDSYNYSTSLSVYDSLGSAHTVSIYFSKVEPNAGDIITIWEWHAVVGPSDHTDGVYTICAEGTLVFGSDGKLTLPVPPPGLSAFNFSGGAEPGQPITFDFEGVSPSTQYSTASTTSYQSQDGYGSGFLEGISVDTDGVIWGSYSNGQILAQYKVALANFTNPGGLSKIGNGIYSASNESGQAFYGPPGTAGLGQISPNSLEQSNVDLGTEFVKMIINQRAFQANSRIITTTDDMLAELINLKR